MQKYYALQHYDDTKHMLASTGHDTDSIKNQVTLDDYNYINKLSDKERTQIEKNFKNLKRKVMTPNHYINGMKEKEMKKKQRKLQE